LPCQTGSSRTGCGKDSEGICSAWEIPRVTSVSGSGKDGGGTTGNEILEIAGKYFGHVRSGADANDIIVRYGSTSTPPRDYVAKSCAVVR